MSRSNPTDSAPNPATRWFEWSGSDGMVRYYDKEKVVKDKDGKEHEGAQVMVKLPFQFLLLDECSTVKGYNKPNKTGIFANEIRDTRMTPFVVKMLNGQAVATGFYADIKDKVANHGGHFTASCYIAFKGAGNKLCLGNIAFKGAALGAWFEFRKKSKKPTPEHKNPLYEMAISISGAVKDITGQVEFFRPTFKLLKTDPKTEEAAKALDVELQEFLKGYFERKAAESPVPEQAAAAEATPSPASRSTVTPAAEPEVGPESAEEVPAGTCTNCGGAVDGAGNCTQGCSSDVPF